MTTDELLNLLQALRKGVNPLTGEVAARGSCLTDTGVQSGIGQLISHLHTTKGNPAAAELISAKEVTQLCGLLRDMDYRPTLAQLAKIFLGSRSIADPRLRGLPEYRRYRGVFTRSAVHDLLRPHEHLIAGGSTKAEQRVRPKQDKPWLEVDFFTTDSFDKLSEDKATELYREVEALGLRKSNDRLPEYMVRARKNVPRAFEPWTREERALLIEAMCYTNDSEKLASVFGRSKSSIQREGQRLIWESQEKRRVA